MIPAIELLLTVAERVAPDIAEELRSAGEISVPVASSFIGSIEYRLISGTLTVNLENGRSYTYGGISLNEFLAFVNARSKGPILQFSD